VTFVDTCQPRVPVSIGLHQIGYNSLPRVALIASNNTRRTWRNNGLRAYAVARQQNFIAADRTDGAITAIGFNDIHHNVRSSCHRSFRTH
jgi:hypothetical protein